MREKQENGVVGEQKDVTYRGWRAMPYVIGNESFNKLGDLGASSNLLVFLITVFNMRSVTATVLVNVWNGTTNIATILGAFLSDAYLGRFATIGYGCVATFLGMAIITLTAAIPALHPHPCSGALSSRTCQGPSPWQLAFLMLGLGLVAVGASGARPCSMAFGADQFDPNTEAGKRGINSFFNWYYFTFTIATMTASTVIVYVQSNVSWTVGMAIPAGLMFVSSALFFLGSPIYVKVRPEGSPFTGVVRVAMAAFRKRRLRLPEGGDSAALFNPAIPAGGLSTRLPRTDQFRFLDKAAIVTRADGIEPNGLLATNPWRLCSLQQIEEVKCLLRVIPIWSTSITYYIVQSLLCNYVILQALQSDRRLGSTNFLIPAASITVFNMLALTICIPIYDQIMVPWLRRVTGKEGGITLLQRIGVGLALSVLAPIISAVVEQKRKRVLAVLHHPSVGFAKDGGAVPLMSSLWLIPQLATYGVSEAFALIGSVEFYYKEFPENMRSVAGSFPYCGMAVGNYLSSLLVTVVHRTTGRRGGEGDSWLAEDLNKGRLDYFYLLTAGLGMVNFIYFLICACWYEYKESCVANEGCDSRSPLLV